jgi:hypothetical protein
VLGLSWQDPADQPLLIAMLVAIVFVVISVMFCRDMLRIGSAW